MSSYDRSGRLPQEIIARLKSAQKIVALTGAGISAESGIPTFRDVQTGLWAKYDPHELATAEAFNSNPSLVWQWYSWRRQIITSAQPNAGHFALVHLENQVEHFHLITQNIDNLHRVAGNQEPIELHGNIFRSRCIALGHSFEEWDEDGQGPPTGPECGSLLRPDVVWFGETPPEHELNASINYSSECDIFLSIGTSAMVYPAASLVHFAMQAGATVIEINLTPTPLSPIAHISIRGAAGEILPLLVNEYFSK